jgi:hypothetical protein
VYKRVCVWVCGRVGVCAGVCVGWCGGGCGHHEWKGRCILLQLRRHGDILKEAAGGGAGGLFDGGKVALRVCGVAVGGGGAGGTGL